jgi:hypothetical protein
MTPKEQVEQLMNEGLPFATRMLAEHGEFHPFGVALTAEGVIQHLGATDGREHPPAQALLDLLLGAMRAGAKEGKYTAIAVFFDVRVQRPGAHSKSDAVQVGLEHRDGYCADVFFPYSLKAGSVAYGDVFAQQRDGSVFVTSSD